MDNILRIIVPYSRRSFPLITRHQPSPQQIVPSRWHTSKKHTSGYQVTFITPEGEEKTCFGQEGEHLLDIAHANNVDLEGACEASLACSTCHVIVESEQMFDAIPEPSDEENDMLDLAFGLTETSRLGCQVKMCKQLDGLRVRIPSATRNMAVDK